MAGHSHWAGIKHKKEATDQKRGRVFSKLLSAISVAAKSEPNPDFNPRLRTAIAKARDASVPSENIERAVRSASESAQNTEELIFEAYGPGGVAILIEAVSDNRNRTVAEIKKILNELGGKWAEPGSVRWAFDAVADQRGPGAEGHGNRRAKFPQELDNEGKAKLKILVDALENHDDVQGAYTNAIL